MIVLLCGLFVWIISFCSAEDVSNLLDILKDDSQTLDAWFNVIYTVSSNDYWVYCLNLYEMRNSSSRAHVQFFMNDTPSLFDWNHLNIFYDQVPSTVCIRVNQPYLYLYNPEGYSFDVSYKIYRLDVLLSTEIPVLSSLECQTEYNLIPIEDVDTNYCVENQLCPACELSGWLSELFINEIQHNSAPLINITIPEEFDWDYSWSDEEFYLEVKWYNVDTEYVDWLIRSQNFKPNSDDFSSILTWLVPLFVPWLAIILFLYFVFRFVKKVF